MSRELLEKTIGNPTAENFIHFFRSKNRSFKAINTSESYYDGDQFSNCWNIGTINFSEVELLLVYIFKVNDSLTEKSGKKKQYEKGKRILKENNAEAGIFIFYDDTGNYRLSLIQVNYTGKKREWSSFRRFTYYVSPMLTNKSFLHQVGNGDFTTIEKILEAFSVEKVTKEFYTEIANWYFWALKHVKFPDDAEDEKDGKNMAVIRMITRIIFIWFMKVRKLIPDELFDERYLKNILNNLKLDSDNYYLAILQNLFFATLNTKQDERRFTSKKKGYRGFSSDFGNHNVYRYEKLFIDSEDAIEKYFLPIPFLNGGLFECLDYKTKQKQDRKYIDGFTSTKSQQPWVPNFLFFSDEKTTKEINKDYGTSDKKYTVRGLINTLSLYNFTIDENEPDDADVALDPELLGKVFENLLASYNPETAKTARKSTGSYYTPRPIVDYMVDESLKQYFQTHIQSEEIENKLKILFSKETHINPFNKNETEYLVSLIDSLRIVDPAVGSGAFPMCILNRLVFLLHKLDAGNILWKKSQIDGVAKNVKDPQLQKQFIEQIERKFAEKNPDYGRKLYLIEKCIYGVDIQQIAVEIAKLRFFISLLVDENINWNNRENNYDIEPLPNLDFKLMQGNSLISSFAGIDFSIKRETENVLIQSNEKYLQLISEYEDLKSQYQNEPDVKLKDVLKNKIEDKLVQIFEEKLSYHFPQIKKIEEDAKSLPNEKSRLAYIELTKEKLFKKIGFDLEKVNRELIAFTEGRKRKEFFLWDVYYAEVFIEKGGFDIAIGNPPWGLEFNNVEKKYFRENYASARSYGEMKGSLDSFSLFIEKGLKLSRYLGTLNYIVPMSINSSDSMSALHKFLFANCENIRISSYFDRPKKIFENAEQPVSIIIAKHTGNDIRELMTTKVNKRYSYTNINEIISNLRFINSKDYYIYGRIPKVSEHIEINILNKLNRFPLKLGNFVTENGQKIYYRTSGGRYYKLITNFPTNSNKENYIKVSNINRDYVCSLLSSNLYFWYYHIYSNCRDLKTSELLMFPIPSNLDDPEHINNVVDIYRKYLQRLEKTSRIKEVSYTNVKSYKEYYPRTAKELIDKIDIAIKNVYGLNEQEIDFIINYDLKFRIDEV